MNFDGLKVVFRTKDTFISARLELECQQAFAVIFENQIKNLKEVIGTERMEMDIRFLQKINESEYLYQKLFELPEKSRSRPATFTAASDRDSQSERHLSGR
jgi:hypothetical protein